MRKKKGKKWLETYCNKGKEKNEKKEEGKKKRRKKW